MCNKRIVCSMNTPFKLRVVNNSVKYLYIFLNLFHT